MVARGATRPRGEGYNLAYKCLSCGGYRWADTARARGETHCLCGTAFPREPVQMPFDRKGPPSTPGGKGAAASADGGRGKSGGPKAAAQAKAWAQATAKGAGREASRRSGETSSATAKSSSEAPWKSLHIDDKRLRDPVYRYGLQADFARRTHDAAMEREAEGNKEAALRERTAALPPHQRVEHLRKRVRTAQEELNRRRRQVEDTEVEIDKLQSRLKLEVESRDDHIEKVQTFQIELQAAEDSLPRPGSAKPVGRQVRCGDGGFVDQLQCLPEQLSRKFGGALTTELRTDLTMHIQAIMDVFKEAAEAKAAREA